MKIISFILLLSTSVFAQCDANDDGNLDILDIIDQVSCILDGCWGSEEETTEIYDYWMLDSMFAEISIGGFPVESFAINCEDEDTTTVMNFNQNGFVYQYPIESQYCGAQEVFLPDTFLVESFTVDGDSISISDVDDYGEIVFLDFVYDIQGNNLTLSNSQSFDDIMPGAVGTTEVYFHRVSILNDPYPFLGHINQSAGNNYLNNDYIYRLLKKLQRNSID